MNKILSLSLKTVPFWASIGLVPIVLVLAAVMFKIVSSMVSIPVQLAYLSVISGEVKISDGITETGAVNGPLYARNVPTLVKTIRGVASLDLWEGTMVIIDSGSIIEFNRQVENDTGISYAFNLVKGRLLMINEKGSQPPFQLIIGSDIVIKTFQGVMGIEASINGEDYEKVDCLVGHCLVNGAYLLVSGQSGHYGSDHIFLVKENVPYTTWVSLGKASNLNPAILSLITSRIPTITPAILPTDEPIGTRPTIPVTGMDAITASPSTTPSMVPSETVTPTHTVIPSPPFFPWLTTYPNWTSTPTEPPGPTSPRIPPPTPVPSLTPSPIVVPIPTLTDTPVPTLTHTPQPTLTTRPTISPSPTDVPTLSPTPQPSHTPMPSATPRPTEVPTLTRTPVPTHTPKPSATPKPTDVPTLPPTQPPTHTPKPSATLKPTDVPTLPPTKPPTHTPKPRLIQF